MEETIEDRLLIKLLAEHTQEGMETAIRLYGGAVKAVCNSILSGYTKEDIEETVSDCFVALWAGIGNFDPERNVSLKSYLYGIARITALNKKRSLAKRTVTENIDNIVSLSDVNVEKEVIGKLDHAILKDLILHMKSPSKEVFLYRYYEQRPVKDIAEKLRISVKKVENILARGKVKLRKQLAENGVSFE